MRRVIALLTVLAVWMAAYERKVTNLTKSRFILIPPVPPARIWLRATHAAFRQNRSGNRRQALSRTRLRGQRKRAVAALCAGAGAGALPAQRGPFAAHG